MSAIRNIQLIVLAAMLALSSLALGACNTMEGFGRDMETAGEGLQDEAQ